MKKSFFFVLALLSVAACQKDASVETEVDGGTPIKFSAYISRGVTKVSVADVTTDNMSEFRVACYQANTTTKYFVKEQTATKTVVGTDVVFKTADSYYWPSTGDQKFDFFAYCGSASEISNSVVGGTPTATITYTVPTTADEDLVAAYKKSQAKTSAVALTFDHILTKIESLTLAPLKTGAGATEQYKYKFTAVTVSTPKNGGTYTFGGDWAVSGSNAEYAFTTQTGDFKGNATKVLQSGTPAVNDQMIIMPQEATFSVTYSVDYSADGTTWSEIMTSTTKTAKITLNKGYSYGITLRLPIDASASSEIVFSVSVNDWVSGSADVDLK